MKFKALVTIDIPGSSEDKRAKFYAVLKESHWHKITDISTAWQVIFSEGVERESAMVALKRDIEKAMNSSNVGMVNYAIQLGAGDLMISIS